MRTIPILFFTGLFVLSSADTPQYGVPYYLWGENGPIAVDYYGSPSVADWNGDGLKDLFFGEFNDGRVSFYPNQGTNDSPVFTYSTYMMAADTILTVPYG